MTLLLIFISVIFINAGIFFDSGFFVIAALTAYAGIKTDKTRKTNCPSCS